MLESVFTREQPKHGWCWGFLYKFSLECLRVVGNHFACHTYYAGLKNSCLLQGLTAVNHYAHAPLCSCLPPNISYFICSASVIAVYYTFFYVRVDLPRPLSLIRLWIETIISEVCLDKHSYDILGEKTKYMTNRSYHSKY